LTKAALSSQLFKDHENWFGQGIQTCDLPHSSLILSQLSQWEQPAVSSIIITASNPLVLGDLARYNSFTKTETNIKNYPHNNSTQINTNINNGFWVKGKTTGHGGKKIEKKLSLSVISSL